MIYSVPDYTMPKRMTATTETETGARNGERGMKNTLEIFFMEIVWRLSLAVFAFDNGLLNNHNGNDCDIWCEMLYIHCKTDQIVNWRKLHFVSTVLVEAFSIWYGWWLNLNTLPTHKAMQMDSVWFGAGFSLRHILPSSWLLWHQYQWDYCAQRRCRQFIKYYNRHCIHFVGFPLSVTKLLIFIYITVWTHHHNKGK